MSRGPKTEEISVIVEQETDAAYLLNNGVDEPAWFPKSKCELDLPSKTGMCTATIEIWLLEKNGWV